MKPSHGYLKFVLLKPGSVFFDIPIKSEIHTFQNFLALLNKQILENKRSFGRCI